MSNGVLTIEDIEEAALKALQNYGQPDYISFPDEASAEAWVTRNMTDEEKVLWRLLYG